MASALLTKAMAAVTTIPDASEKMSVPESHPDELVVDLYMRAAMYRWLRRDMLLEMPFHVVVHGAHRPNFPVPRRLRIAGSISIGFRRDFRDMLARRKPTTDPFVRSHNWHSE